MVRTLDELTDIIKGKFSENPTDDEIALLEDVTDTFNSFSASGDADVTKELEELKKSNSEWEQKYTDNDNMWRKKYTDRFKGKVEDIPDVRQELDNKRGESISIEDLFTPNGN